MEKGIKKISSNVDSTIKNDMNSLALNNQTTSHDNTNVQQNNSNSTTSTKIIKWNFSSFETSSTLEPAKVQCEKGAILKEELCSKLIYLHKRNARKN